MEDKKGIRRCIIITGMSGAGKSSALNVFEDQGLYTVDNLPPELLPQLLDLLSGHHAAAEHGVAAVVDVRSRELLCDFGAVAASLREKCDEVKILFTDATDEALVRRYETTRRRHPLADSVTILQGIQEERNFLKDVVKNADILIDTTDLKLPIFKSRLLAASGISVEEPAVIVTSFGFKYGAPHDADYVLDVRFLPNPNYVDELHLLSGKDEPVRQYLRGFKELEEFLLRAKPLYDYLASVYGGTGKKQMHICVGCTGGRHRSVAVAEMLGSYLSSKGRKVRIQHRDIGKGEQL